MNKKIVGTFAIAISIFLANPTLAANTFKLRGIGEMKVPAYVTITPGMQESIAFREKGGVQKFFNKLHVSHSEYYNITYNHAPDYSYGYAMSHRLGAPFLFEIGQFKEKDAPAEHQMDVIADYINQLLIKQGAIYDGENPLRKFTNKKEPYWEGTFTLRTREKGILFSEQYYLILQTDGYFTTLGIINFDADQTEVVKSLQSMVKARKFPKN